VDSFRSNGGGGKAYLLLPGKADIMEDDQQFDAYSEYVHRALGKKGFTPAESFEEADVAIFLSYGVGEPQRHQLLYYVPAWNRTIVPSADSSGQVRPYARGDPSAEAAAKEDAGEARGGGSGVVTYTTHLRYMILEAFALGGHGETEEEAQLWRTAVRSTGTSGDLERVLPILVAASIPYMATNTETRIRLELDENDHRVVDIRRTREKGARARKDKEIASERR
jgi:hypothetical protein